MDRSRKFAAIRCPGRFCHNLQPDYRLCSGPGSPKRSENRSLAAQTCQSKPGITTRVSKPYIMGEFFRFQPPQPSPPGRSGCRPGPSISIASKTARDASLAILVPLTNAPAAQPYLYYKAVRVRATAPLKLKPGEYVPGLLKIGYHLGDYLTGFVLQFILEQRRQQGVSTILVPAHAELKVEAAQGASS